jgi:hypothetical protein
MVILFIIHVDGKHADRGGHSPDLFVEHKIKVGRGGFIAFVVCLLPAAPTRADTIAACVLMSMNFILKLRAVAEYESAFPACKYFGKTGGWFKDMPCL